MGAGIIAGVVAAIAGLILVFENWGDICEWFRDLWDTIWGAIKASLTGIFMFFSDTFGLIISLITSTFSGIADFLSGIWDNISGACSSAWDGIKNIIEFTVKLIASILDAAAQIITLPFAFIWENCSEIGDCQSCRRVNFRRVSVDCCSFRLYLGRLQGHCSWRIGQNH